MEMRASELSALSLHDALPIWRLQIERHALLAGVQQEEEPRVLAALVAERGAAGLARGRLDLDHVGAEPREHLGRSEEHTSELQSLRHLVCRLLLEKKNIYFTI